MTRAELCCHTCQKQNYWPLIPLSDFKKTLKGTWAIRGICSVSNPNGRNSDFLSWTTVRSIRNICHTAAYQKKKKKKNPLQYKSSSSAGARVQFPQHDSIVPLHSEGDESGWGGACGLLVRDGISVTVLVISCWITREALQRRDQDLGLSQSSVPFLLRNTTLEPKERKDCWLLESNISHYL